MSSIQIRVCGRYRLEDRLYEGKNSSIYSGKNVQSDTNCAIKSQPISLKYSFVKNQGKILQQIQGGVGIPNLLWYGQNGDFNFLVTQLMGPSLQDYFDICGRNFSLKTVLMIADKIISSVEFIHYKNYLHRDIKPQNFVMGLGKKLHQIYIIDFAFATSYFNPQQKCHRPDKVSQQKFVGTLRYSSLNVLRGHQNSRRDDLQSVGLMLVYFLKGKLPWQGAYGQTLKTRKRQILKVMQKTSLTQLCQGLPKQFQVYLEYCRKLKYEQTPDYNYLKRLFKQKFIKEGFHYDHIYDWILIPLKLKNTELSNRIPINRRLKKQNQSLSMCNYDYDFSQDLKFDENVFKTRKQQDIKKQHQIRNKQIRDTRRRAGSEVKPTKPKKGKEECLIY